MPVKKEMSCKLHHFSTVELTETLRWAFFSITYSPLVVSVLGLGKLFLFGIFIFRIPVKEYYYAPSISYLCQCLFDFRQLNGADKNNIQTGVHGMLLYLATHCTAAWCFEIVIQGISAAL